MTKSQESKGVSKKGSAKANRDVIGLGLAYHKCSICGKNFITYKHFDWAYKTFRYGGKKLYCSYPCMRKAQKSFKPTWYEREAAKWKEIWKAEGII